MSITALQGEAHFDMYFPPEGKQDYHQARKRLQHPGVRPIEGFRPRGHCNFTKDFAEQLPVRIFMALVDLPLKDAPQIKYWADQTTRPDGSMAYAETCSASSCCTSRRRRRPARS